MDLSLVNRVEKSSKTEFVNLILIDKNSIVPKYKQIISSIEKAILTGKLKKGDKLPSLNKIKNRLSLSRDTVILAYKELKIKGIIQSCVGKGYYVKSEDINISKKVFLLFDEPNAFKEIFYSSFLSNLDETIKVNLFFHRHDYDFFSNLINDNIHDYGYYVISPSNLENVQPLIDVLPEDRVCIINQTLDEFKKYSSIFQNYERGIFCGLEKAKEKILKYKRFIFVFDPKKQPINLLNGYKLFCKKHGVNYKIINHINDIELRKEELYLILEDKSLITIIKKAKILNFKLRRDFGIISYNDSPIKEIIEGGITTISTDIKNMGKQLAEMLLKKQGTRIESKTFLITRNSL